MEDLNVRDLFAMLAMCGDLAGRNNEADAEEYEYEIVANRAYSMADEMMKEKERRDEQA
jgi:hypothetical protein